MEVTTTGRHCAHEFSKTEDVSIFLHAQQKSPGFWRAMVCFGSFWFGIQVKPSGDCLGQIVLYLPSYTSLACPEGCGQQQDDATLFLNLMSASGVSLLFCSLFLKCCQDQGGLSDLLYMLHLLSHPRERAHVLIIAIVIRGNLSASTTCHLIFEGQTFARCQDPKSF